MPMPVPALAVALAALVVTLAGGAAAAQPAAEPAEDPRTCEGCGAADAPSGPLPAEARLAPPGEPGTPLVVTGVVYRPDGRTPAPGVLVYAYQTDATGVYPPRPGAAGVTARHGRLRGWLRTDARGRYRLTTVRPAPYPRRDDPAHIHMTVTPPGGEERWIDSIVFADDPLLTAAQRRRLRNIGGPGVVRVGRGRDGVLRATRDVVLERWP